MSLLCSENLYDNQRAAAEHEQTSTISIYRKKVDTKAVLMGLEPFQESNLHSLHPFVENLTPIFPHKAVSGPAFFLFCSSFQE